MKLCRYIYIPYSDFKDRIRKMKEFEDKKCKIEVFDSYMIVQYWEQDNV